MLLGVWYGKYFSCNGRLPNLVIAFTVPNKRATGIFKLLD
ncbi:Hypothetical protein AJF4211_001960 [Avibacterium paragallinarum JF4211]|nr:Hypothetical protein AJF4211_001960 [Avibacterium paragallinarum JF4211]